MRLAACGLLWHGVTDAARFAALCGESRITSKHYKWQTRWRIDASARSAVHDCGLIVQFAALPGDSAGPPGVALNVPQTLAQLEPRHGHNAYAMIQRMAREAAQIYRGERR